MTRDGSNKKTCYKLANMKIHIFLQSEEKFAESLQLAQLGMHNLLDGYGAEHITQVRKKYV